MTVRFLNRMRMRTHQRSFGAPLGYLRFNGNPEFDLDGQQKSAKGKAPQQPDRDFEACARINERKSEERIPRHSGNCYQTLLKTTTGIWHVTYNAENRPILFSNDTTKVEMAYDYMGRRFEYKETVSGTLTRHERYLYRGYLQIAALDVLNSASVKHTIVWDPSEPTATRPLCINFPLPLGEGQGEGMYTYAFDQVKNVTELFDSTGALAATYDYAPFGAVTAFQITQSGTSVSASSNNAITQFSNPLTFGSEIHDSTLGLQYYNYRHLNTLDGRWVNRDPIENIIIRSSKVTTSQISLLYVFLSNNFTLVDYLGLLSKSEACSRALANSGGAEGTIVCYCGTPIPCVRKLNSKFPSEQACVLRHENVHCSLTKCRPNEIYVPKFPDASTRKLEECLAYLTSLKCLRSAMEKDCGSSYWDVVKKHPDNMTECEFYYWNKIHNLITEKVNVLCKGIILNPIPPR